MPKRTADRQLVLPLGPDGGSGRRSSTTSCVYCGKSAATRDHVPPKFLLRRPFPPNLRTVPACLACNNEAAKDEQYLSVLIAHIGDSPHHSAQLASGGAADRALVSAPALDDRIERSLDVDEDGRVFISPEHDRIARVVTKIAYGLHCLAYGPHQPLTAFRAVWHGPAGDGFPPPLAAAQFFRPGIRRKPWTVVQPEAFAFLFARGWMTSDPGLYCFLDLQGAMYAVVACPAPQRRSSK